MTTPSKNLVTIITILLQGVVVLIGICAVAFLLWEPRIEGRNVNATQFEIYFKDPFLTYIYIASASYFIGLYHSFKLLGRLRYKGEPEANIRSLHIIKHCAIAMIGFVALGMVFMLQNNNDDRAGGFFIGLLVSLCSLITIVVAARLEQTLKKQG